MLPYRARGVCMLSLCLLGFFDTIVAAWAQQAIGKAKL